jgi:hypothetical protein
VQERLVLLLAGLAGVVLLVGGLRPYLESQPETVSTLSIPELKQPIRIAIFNGCGASQLAARMTKKARGLGLDVIDEGNADSFEYSYSMTIDRVGDLDKARRVADILGIPHYIQQVSEDEFRLEEVSVIIGRDYQKLRLLDP